ncbi:MAG: hypothetical protein R3233_11700 [Xanthomonadales bacterium]|nr:hypothetical protein [Xanthomonadales bacterium]
MRSDARARELPPLPSARAASRPVVSNQPGVHPRLAERVRRHLESPWQRPLHRPTMIAFDALLPILDAEPDRPLVLDSGCGSGASTRLLARRHPEALVLGVDRSASRLARDGHHRLPHREGNALWLRAELATLWRSLRAAGHHPAYHYLLYPNPWPKAVHLQRRWHAHPAFADLLALGGRLEMRCNWKTYAKEFAQALALATGEEHRPERIVFAAPITPFERKYLASGHALYAVTADLVYQR